MYSPEDESTDDVGACDMEESIPEDACYVLVGGGEKEAIECGVGCGGTEMAVGSAGVGGRGAGTVGGRVGVAGVVGVVDGFG